MIDLLTQNFIKLLSSMQIEYKRYFYHKINFDYKLIGIIGPRGVGKTIALLQYLKESDVPLSKKLYFNADSIEIADYTLLEIAKRFESLGGELLVIDEIHKYKNFEQELKNIYDLLSLKVIFSGSSALKLEHSRADLSRRAMLYKVEGLSYREFLELKTGKSFSSYKLEDILQNHLDITMEILNHIKPLEFWQEYLHQGYYPFYFENPDIYLSRLESIINTVIEVDLPMIFSIKYENIINLKKLVKLLCLSEPFKLNISQLSRKIGIDRDTLYLYMEHLRRGSILNLLKQKGRGDSIFIKPQKLYLHNTNLYYAYCKNPKIGTIRETFLINQLIFKHSLSYPKNGDLIIDDKFLCEIGGKSKSFKQIKDIKNSFVTADDIQIGYGNKIPLWLFGFLY